jgi:hypothetical protein
MGLIQTRYLLLGSFRRRFCKRSLAFLARSLAALTRSFEFSSITRASSARTLACSRALRISSSSEPVIFQAPTLKPATRSSLPDLASARRYSTLPSFFSRLRTRQRSREPLPKGRGLVRRIERTYRPMLAARSSGLSPALDGDASGISRGSLSGTSGGLIPATRWLHAAARRTGDGSSITDSSSRRPA